MAIDLGRELGRGGEGSVFEVPSLAHQVAKVYHLQLDRRKQDKLSFMVRNGDEQLLNYVAWPQTTLHANPGGPTVGFLMPEVVGKAPVHMVYSPAHRRQDYPKMAWNFLLFVARNIAASFDTVHSHGHVIGDVNQDSVMVGRDSKVVLIDSDSFQVNARGTKHLCEVGVAHFTPPELQAIKTFDGVERSANHDNFGLALLIFHVLLGGRHPFSGVPLLNGVGEALETDIKNYRYAYGRDSRSRGIAPPPRSIPMSMLPDPVEAMFAAAFTERGASASGRPSAKDWVLALDGMRGGLKWCAASAVHTYPGHLGACPWCGLEQQGVIYFIDLGATFVPTTSGFALARVWALIQAVPPPSPLKVPSPDDFSATPAAWPAGAGKGSESGARLVVVVLAILLAFVMPKASLAWLIGGWILWFVVGSSSKEYDTEQARRRRALDEAESERTKFVEQAKRDTGADAFLAKKAELTKARDEYQGLPDAEKRALDALHATARDRQLQQFLDTCFIDSARIPGVGNTRKSALRSFGIETAADVDRHRILQIKGFGTGLVQALMDWRATCERRFTFNPARAVSESDKNAVKIKFASRKATLEGVLGAGPGELERLRQRAATQQSQVQMALEGLTRKVSQARADCSIV